MQRGHLFGGFILVPEHSGEEEHSDYNKEEEHDEYKADQEQRGRFVKEAFSFLVILSAELASLGGRSDRGHVVDCFFVFHSVSWCEVVSLRQACRLRGNARCRRVQTHRGR